MKALAVKRSLPAGRRSKEEAERASDRRRPATLRVAGRPSPGRRPAHL